MCIIINKRSLWNPTSFNRLNWCVSLSQKETKRPQGDLSFMVHKSAFFLVVYASLDAEEENWSMCHEKHDKSDVFFEMKGASPAEGKYSVLYKSRQWWVEISNKRDHFNIISSIYMEEMIWKNVAWSEATMSHLLWDCD